MSAEPATPLTDVSVPEESIHGFAANWVSTEAPKTIEEAILRHSWRGMLELSAFVSPTYCHDAAREILSWPRGPKRMVLRALWCWLLRSRNWALRP